MSIYTSFDYLSNEPFYLEGIGTVKCPTLRDIRRVTYRVFELYLSLVTITRDSLLKLSGMEEQFSAMSGTEQEAASLFHLLLYKNPELMMGMLKFFLLDEVEFNAETGRFDISSASQEKIPMGSVGSDNFELFQEEMKYILGLGQKESLAPKFANETARKLYQKLEQHREDQKKNQKADENYSLDNMVRKYCTHNKVGINILNVWDMTYYQFHSMFSEYCSGRHYDFNDSMAANTFSFKKSSDYKPMEYLKKLNM